MQGITGDAAVTGRSQADDSRKEKKSAIQGQSLPLQFEPMPAALGLAVR